MSTTTTNLHLTKVADGEYDWNQPFNGNWDAIEAFYTEFLAFKNSFQWIASLPGTQVSGTTYFVQEA